MKIDKCCLDAINSLHFVTPDIMLTYFGPSPSGLEHYSSLSRELGPALQTPMQAMVVLELAGGGPVTAVHPTRAAVTYRLQLDDFSFSCRSKHEKHQSE